MTKNNAIEIAELLNKRNQLLTNYTYLDVLSNKESYVFIKEKDKVIACAETVKVQWYQNEIKHVSVNENFEGEGFGSKILKLAEDKALKNNARVLQCTIRNDNDSSIRLFTRNGYKKVNIFFNRKTQNMIFIFQKILSNKNDK